MRLDKLYKTMQYEKFRTLYRQAFDQASPEEKLKLARALTNEWRSEHTHQ